MNTLSSLGEQGYGEAEEFVGKKLHRTITVQIK